MISRKTALTILISGTVAVLLPVTLIMLIRKTMAPMITRDNAGIVFSEFQAALDQGSLIRDPVTAASVAVQRYREKTSAILLDGWGRRMHIYAVLHGASCELNIQSAGPDGNFGNSDDLTIQQTFDLTPPKTPVRKPPESEHD